MGACIRKTGSISIKEIVPSVEGIKAHGDSTITFEVGRSLRKLGEKVTIAMLGFS
jgi:hypothetical protein